MMVKGAAKDWCWPLNSCFLTTPEKSRVDAYSSLTCQKFENYKNGGPAKQVLGCLGTGKVNLRDCHVMLTILPPFLGMLHHLAQTQLFGTTQSSSSRTKECRCGDKYKPSWKRSCLMKEKIRRNTLKISTRGNCITEKVYKWSGKSPW